MTASAWLLPVAADSDTGGTWRGHESPSLSPRARPAIRQPPALAAPCPIHSKAAPTPPVTDSMRLRNGPPPHPQQRQLPRRRQPTRYSPDMHRLRPRRPLRYPSALYFCTGNTAELTAPLPYGKLALETEIEVNG